MQNHQFKSPTKEALVNKIVNITALAVLIAAGLSGCVDDNDGFSSGSSTSDAPFTTVQECVDNGNSQDVCQRAYDQASTAYQSAPHYATQDDCYAKYGPNGCQQYHDSNGNSWFMPFMIGYMLGNNHSTYVPVYRSYSGGYQTVVVNNGAPVYSSVSSGAGRTGFSSTGYSSSGGGVSSAGRATATTSARGGFGGGSSGGSSGG